MARGGVNKELAATVLVEAAYFGDEKACERNGVSVRSLQRFRQMLASGDAQLAEFVAMKKRAWDAAWAETLPKALRESAEYISKATAQAKENPVTLRNPVMLTAVAGALKLLADVYYTGKVIDARLAEANRRPAALPGQIPAEADGEPASKLIH